MNAYDTYIQADDGGHYKYLKTASGHAYTACTKKSASSHYWSTDKGSDGTVNDGLVQSSDNNKTKNFGTTSGSYVPLFENIYMSRGSLIRCQTADYLR